MSEYKMKLTQDQLDILEGKQGETLATLSLLRRLRSACH